MAHEKFHYKNIEQVIEAAKVLNLHLPFAKDTKILAQPMKIRNIVLPNRLGVLGFFDFYLMILSNYLGCYFFLYFGQILTIVSFFCSIYKSFTFFCFFHFRLFYIFLFLAFFNFFKILFLYFCQYIYLLLGIIFSYLILSFLTILYN